MKVWSDSFESGARIPTKYAFCKHDPEKHFALERNVSPHVAWSDVPPEAKSLVLVLHDPDVPSKPDDVNQEGRTVPADLPRVDFYHWLLVDLPPNATPLKEGEFSDGVTPKGKTGPETARGLRAGANDYTSWFEGDAEMGGTYFGYDGPCPPWNDEIVHHYHFTLYALDVERCPVEGTFRGPDLKKAIEEHVVAEASFVGLYAVYPDAKER